MPVVKGNGVRSLPVRGAAAYTKLAGKQGYDVLSIFLVKP
jgi:hypothetical protein